MDALKKAAKNAVNYWNRLDELKREGKDINDAEYAEAYGGLVGTMIVLDALSEE